MTFHDFGGTEVLTLDHLPIPEPKADQLLIHVVATSVNPIDCRMRRGEFRPLLPRHAPYVVGFDVAGLVVKGGARTSLPVGTPVVGLAAPWHRGASAEYLVLSADRVIPKPASSTFGEAASIPLVGLTAHDSLEWARLTPGEELLVVGASGGVGTMLLQLGRSRGARVTTVTSRRNVQLVRDLGADECIAYDEEDVRGRYDVVVDAAGTMTYRASRAHLTARGRYVALTPKPSNLLGAVFAPRAHMAVLPDPRGLEALFRLVDRGEVRPVIDRTYGLAELRDAHRLSESRRARGKLVIGVDESRIHERDAAV